MRTLLLCCIVSSPSLLFAQVASDSIPPIIDVHLHAFGVEQLAFFGKDPDWYDSYKEQTFDALDRFNILAITSGPAENVLEWREQRPDRIIPGLLVFAASMPDQIFEPDSIRAMNARGDLEVIGEVSAQHLGMRPTDPKLEPMWAVAEELDIPVGYHMGPSKPGAALGEGPFSKYRSYLSNPLLLEEVLVRHPNLRLYVMHAGWPMIDEMISILFSYPNVYVDVGILNWAAAAFPDFHNYLKQLVDAGFEDRIMFGSDQVVWPHMIGPAIDRVESAPFLSENQKRKIFYDNAVRFFRLEERLTGTDGAR